MLLATRLPLNAPNALNRINLPRLLENAHLHARVALTQTPHKGNASPAQPIAQSARRMASAPRVLLKLRFSNWVDAPMCVLKHTFGTPPLVIVNHAVVQAARLALEDGTTNVYLVKRVS